MNISFSDRVHSKLKKLDVRIRKSFKEKILIFSINPSDPVLNNHPLSKNYIGYKSIDITTDYRAVFKEIEQGEELIYYFITIDTHEELYES